MCLAAAPLGVLHWKGPRLWSSPVTEQPEYEVPRSLLSLVRRGLPAADCGERAQVPTPGVGRIRV